MQIYAHMHIIMLIRQLDGFHPHEIEKLRANSNSKLELDVVGNSARHGAHMGCPYLGAMWVPLGAHNGQSIWASRGACGQKLLAPRWAPHMGPMWVPIYEPWLLVIHGLLG